MDNWSFYDKTKTSAEIVKNFYKVIKDSSDGAVIIGCNVIGHLCAGLHQLNRTGDDTSGFEWCRTAKMGVNTLAFRVAQNNAFFGADADCVGIMGKYSWDQNRLWLDLLTRSGSPLFVSCDPKVADQKVKQDIKDAFIINCKQDNICYPIDYKQNLLPTKWSIDGEVVEYDWHLIP
jgi:alpha-galactosidase